MSKGLADPVAPRKDSFSKPICLDAGQEKQSHKPRSSSLQTGVMCPKSASHLRQEIEDIL